MAMPRKAVLPSTKELLEDPSLFLKLPFELQLAFRDVLRSEASSRGLGTAYPDPMAFARHFSGEGLLNAPHLEFLNKKLVKIFKEGGRLLVSLPPGHGKSTLISLWFPLWVLTQDPTKLIGLICHTDRYASTWGYKTRRVVEEQGEALRLKLSDDYLARDNWRLVNGRGGMTCEGITGGMTGKRLNVLIIDDPIKTEVEASSELHRMRLKEMWETVGLTRLEPGACVVVVATRWHEDDLIGHLKLASESGTGLPFEVIHLPAIAEDHDVLGRAPGEPLWPERFPLSTLKTIQEGGMTPYNWAALYQQRPVPAGGGKVLSSWWRFWTHQTLPAEFDFMVQSWDLSLKAGLGSDPAVGQLWGRKGACFYLLAQVRGQYSLPKIIELVRQFQLRFPKAFLKLIEDKAAGPALIQSLQQSTGGVVAVKVKDSKESRLEAVLPAIEAGNVYLPGNVMGDPERWVQEFIHEFSSFPKGTHDDQIDACTQALNRLLPQGWQAARSAHDEALDENGEILNPEQLAKEWSKQWVKERIAENDQDMDAQDWQAMEYLFGQEEGF